MCMLVCLTALVNVVSCFCDGAINDSYVVLYTECKYSYKDAEKLNSVNETSAFCQPGWAQWPALIMYRSVFLRVVILSPLLFYAAHCNNNTV